MKEIRSYTVELLQEIQTQEGTYRHENMTNKKCPTCGKRLLAVNGKNAKLLVCQDRSCGYRETLSRTSNARCPVCHKKMELSGGGDNATFFCSCGYRERLSKFKERRQKEGAGVSKRDVNAYLKKQQKEAAEPVNNAFAAALAGIKLEK
jgi:DNA topoisomerase-3